MARGKPNKTPQHLIDRATANFRANLEENLAKQRERLQALKLDPIAYQAYLEAKREYDKTYRKENPEKISAYSRKHRTKNREKYNAVCRARHAANPEVKRSRERQWRKNNPEKAKLKDAVARLNRRARGGRKLRVAEVLAVKQAHGDTCFYCKNSNATDIEHKTPICRGGTNDPENLVMSCKLCNNRKFKMTAEEFLERAEREGLFLKAA